MAKEDFKPYLSLGYASYKEDEGDIELKGSGAIFAAGLEGSLDFWHPNLYYTTELGFSPFELEGESQGITVTSDFSSFGIGLSMIYYF